jgi:hypothetical protein
VVNNFTVSDKMTVAYGMKAAFFSTLVINPRR